MHEPEIKNALSAMGRASTREPPPSEQRRAAIVDAMVRAATPAARAPRGFPRRGVALFAAAAVVVIAGAATLRTTRRPRAVADLAAVGYAHRLAGEVVVLGGAGAAAARPDGEHGVALRSGDRVATLAGGRATVHLGETAAATLQPNSELVVSAGASECAVGVGTVGFDVAHLGAAASFVVHTPEADVIVHGTSFRVTVEQSEGEDAPHTEVSVSSGVVVVHPRSGEDARLVAGGHWPSDSAPPAPVARVATSAEPARAAVVPSAGRTSELADQNQLLADAAAAKKRGDAGAEARALDAYLQRFPRSPGTHDAVAARMRLSARSGDASGAKRYLAMFPSGPLREEASAIVAGAKAP